MNDIKFMTGKRGKTLLIHQNQKFYSVRSLKNGVGRWRCILKKCNANLYTCDDNKTIIHEGKHSHVIDTTRNQSKISRAIFTTRCKRISIENRLEKPTKIMETVLKSLPSDMAQFIIKQDFLNVRKVITTARKQARYTKDNPRIDSLRDPSKDLTPGEAITNKQSNPQSMPVKKNVPIRLNPEEIIKIVIAQDENTPEGLQRKFFHIAGLQLGWHLNEASSCLIEYFKEELTDQNVKTGRLEYKPNQIADTKFLTPNIENVHFCPVRLFSTMCSKRTNNVKTTRLFLSVNKYWARGDRSWYNNAPLGIKEMTDWLMLDTDTITPDTRQNDAINDLSRTETIVEDNNRLPPYQQESNLNNDRRNENCTFVNSLPESSSTSSENTSENLCRTCLLPNATVDIHSTQIGNNFLIDVLVEMAPINKQNNLKFKLICNNCYIKIASFVAFREQIVNSDKKLKNIDSEKVNNIINNSCSQDSDEIFTNFCANYLKSEQITIKNEKVMDNDSDSDQEHQDDDLKSDESELEEQEIINKYRNCISSEDLECTADSENAFIFNVNVDNLKTENTSMDTISSEDCNPFEQIEEVYLPESSENYEVKPEIIHEMHHDYDQPNISSTLTSHPEIKTESRISEANNHKSSKSSKIYQHAYDKFIAWCNKKNIKNISDENVLLAYFADLSNKMNWKSSTIWSQYSMVKSLLGTKHGIDTSKYLKLRAYLKKQNEGYTPKKSRTLTKEQFDKFLFEASDVQYLDLKVVLLIGVFGACLCDELIKLTVDDFQDMGDWLSIKIADSKLKKVRCFEIAGENYIKIYRKYVSIRPPYMEEKRFFIKYVNGNCFNQVMGIHKIGSVCKNVATYLELPNPQEYTGHCLRRTAALILENGGDDS